jgi:hypothetical protein
MTRNIGLRATRRLHELAHVSLAVEQALNEAQPHRLGKDRETLCHKQQRVVAQGSVFGHATEQSDPRPFGNQRDGASCSLPPARPQPRAAASP